MARISLDGNDEDGGLEVRILSCLFPSFLSFSPKTQSLTDLRDRTTGLF